MSEGGGVAFRAHPAINRAGTLFGSVQEPQHTHGRQGRETLLHPGSASGVRTAGPADEAAGHYRSPRGRFP